MTERSFEGDLAEWSGAKVVISDEDEALVRALLLDSLAVMGTGSSARPAQALQASTIPNSPGPVAVIGTGRSSSPGAAALLNATAGASELWDDTSLWMNTHSSVPIFAALMSVAPELEPSLGDVIEAYVVGLEAQLAVRSQTGHSLYLRGYHSTGLLGVIGCAMAVAHLRRYPPHLMARVLGIAASMGSGVRAQFGSDVMPLHSGFAAERGLAAVEFAAAGVVPDRRAITGRYGLVECFSDEPAITDHWTGPMGLGSADIVLKRYPIGAPNIAPVDAALRLRERLGGSVDLASVRSITCHADRWVEYTIGVGVPPAPHAARVNLPFCVIAALAHGQDLPSAFHGDDEITGETRRLIESFAVEVGDFRDESGQRSAEVELAIGDTRVSASSSADAYVLPTLEGGSGEAIYEKVMAVRAFGGAGPILFETVASGAASLPFRTILDVLAK